MRRIGMKFLFFSAVMVMACVAAAEDRDGSEPPPSLEYQPPRQVIPEPKAPHPLPPKTVFEETIGSFGISTGSFDRPVDIALGKSRFYSFYVLDADNNRVQAFGGPSNSNSIFWGSRGSREDQFNNPSAIAVVDWEDYGEYVYVVDTGNNRVQYTRAGEPFGTIGNRASGGRWGSLGTAKGDFNNPRDIAIDRDGNKIYVLDSGNERVQRFLAPNGELEPGQTFELRGGIISGVTSIAFSGEDFGYLYTFGPGCLIQKFSLKGGNDGTLVSSWSAIAPESGLCVPGRIEVGGREHFVYVLDVGNSLLMCFNPNVGGMYRWALRGAQRPFTKPLGVAINDEGDEFLVADTGNDFVQKFTLR